MPKDLSELTIEKLQKLSSALEEADPEGEELKQYKAEIARRTGKPAKQAPGSDAFELDMTPDELADIPTGFSDRPVAGEYPAEIGIPDLDYSPNATKIPFTIIDGVWKGFDADAFYPGKSAAAAFSIKNICEAADIKAQVNPKTGKAFYPLMQLAGKTIIVVYKDDKGTFVGNDGIEREFTRAKVKHAKPYRKG